MGKRNTKSHQIADASQRMQSSSSSLLSTQMAQLYSISYLILTPFHCTSCSRMAIVFIWMPSIAQASQQSLRCRILRHPSDGFSSSGAVPVGSVERHILSVRWQFGFFSFDIGWWVAVERVKSNEFQPDLFFQLVADAYVVIILLVDALSLNEFPLR